jgi:nucleoside-diphosphate-sugar epimerase
MVLRAAVGCSAIVHLAAPVHDWTQAKSRTLTQATIDGAANAAEAAREQNARLALVSTVGVYGTPSPSPVDERTATAPTTDYASAKLAAEERCQLVLPDTLVVRCAVVYGPGDRGNVWRLLCAIKRRRALVVGGGTNRKSIIYSENLADRILTAIATQTSGVWCAADQPALTQFELTKKIAQALGRPTPRSVPIGLTLAVARVADRIESLRVSGSSRWTTMVHSLMAETVVDGTRFDRKIGYAQAISIDEGLRRTIAAWQRGAQ